MIRIRVLAMIAAAAVALAAAALATSAEAYSQYGWLNSVASQLSGRNVKVRCLTFEESMGDPVIAVWGASAYVESKTQFGSFVPKNYTVFAYGECENLMALHRGDLSGRKVADIAWSILVIIHESGHLRGERWAGSEAKTQCWAMRNYKSATRDILGVSNPVAVELLYSYAYMWQQGMEPQYKSKCPGLPVPLGVNPSTLGVNP